MDLFEEARILDRDYRLVSEGGDQLNLLLCKRLYRPTEEVDDANRATFTKEWHPERGTKACLLLNVEPFVFGVHQDVGDLNGSTFQEGSSDDASSPRLVWDALEIFLEPRGKVVDRGVVISAALLAGDGGHIRFAQSRHRLGQRIEHRLQIEGRAANHLEHVGGGGLLLQRFRKIIGALSQLLQQPRVFDRDDGLIGEILDQLDLLIGEPVHLLATDMYGAD